MNFTYEELMLLSESVFFNIKDLKEFIELFKETDSLKTVIEKDESRLSILESILAKIIDEMRGCDYEWK